MALLGKGRWEGSTLPCWDSVSWHITWLIQAPCSATMHYLLLKSFQRKSSYVFFSFSRSLLLCHRGQNHFYEGLIIWSFPVLEDTRTLLQCATLSLLEHLNVPKRNTRKGPRAGEEMESVLTEMQVKVHIQSQRFSNDKSQKPCQGTGQCPRDGHGIIKKEVSVGQSNYFHS